MWYPMPTILISGYKGRAISDFDPYRNNPAYLICPWLFAHHNTAPANAIVDRGRNVFLLEVSVAQELLDTGQHFSHLSVCSNGTLAHPRDPKQLDFQQHLGTLEAGVMSDSVSSIRCGCPDRLLIILYNHIINDHNIPICQPKCLVLNGQLPTFDAASRCMTLGKMQAADEGLRAKA